MEKPSIRVSVMVVVWQSEISWEILTSAGEVLVTGGSPAAAEVCLADGNYTFKAIDSYGDGWNGNVFTLTDLSGNIWLQYELTVGFEGTTDFTVGGDPPVYGCTDETALNYDPNATVDDGSCYFTGEVCEAPLLDLGAQMRIQAESLGMQLISQQRLVFLL